MGPLHHTTLSLVQFKRSGVMTFLYLNIYVWVSSTTPKSAEKSIRIGLNNQAWPYFIHL